MQTLRSHRTLVLSVLATLVTVAVLAGPGLQSGADPAPRKPATTTTPPAPSGEPSGDPSGKDGAPLADGRHFGRIPAAYVAPDELVFDEMELVDGDDGPSVRDRGRPTLSLPVSPDVVVTAVACGEDGCDEGVPSDYATLTRADADRLSSTYYEVTVKGGWVVRIDERYLA